jgi:aerobic carbon-monoxide dehydrogenase medium subunit
VIPMAFDYDRPTSVADAVRLLGTHGGGAKILAGGHSLLPMMKLRLAAPERLIDISRIPGLDGITEDGGQLVVGALTTHRDVASSDVVQRTCPALAETAAGIGDMQVRNRGTIGGSLVHADPHGDLPALLVALGGEVVAEGPNGERVIPADELYVDYLTTSVSPDELVTQVRVPKVRQAAYVKFNRRSQDWAIVGAAVALTGSAARIALTGVGSTPLRANAAEAAWSGSNAQEAAAQAAEGLDPPSDVSASGEYRKHLARVLTRRALETALAR